MTACLIGVVCSQAWRTILAHKGSLKYPDKLEVVKSQNNLKYRYSCSSSKSARPGARGRMVKKERFLRNSEISQDVWKGSGEDLLPLLGLMIYAFKSRQQRTWGTLFIVGSIITTTFNPRFHTSIAGRFAFITFDSSCPAMNQKT